ncbi:MAG: ferrous iron transport protein A [Bdellovibrionales bacterium]|nr:ferrous iron transport protein A [Bdellovibrionales bacterium]
MSTFAQRSLWSLPKGTTGIVKFISQDLESSYRQRLLDFGISPGAEIFCLRQSVWGGPRVYQIGDLAISFEKKIAEMILLEAQ